jgi:hypothetical protein
MRRLFAFAQVSDPAAFGMSRPTKKYRLTGSDHVPIHDSVTIARAVEVARDRCFARVSATRHTISSWLISVVKVRNSLALRPIISFGVNQNGLGLRLT